MILACLINQIFRRLQRAGYGSLYFPEIRATPIYLQDTTGVKRGFLGVDADGEARLQEAEERGEAGPAILGRSTFPRDEGRQRRQPRR